MKEYPSIPKDIRNDISVYVFDKIDGSNIRAEWNKKKGFYKFGSRHQLLGEDDKVLGKSISLIRNKYEEELSKIFRDDRLEQTICFFEFYGPNSFAGYHDPNDNHTVTLIDISIYRKGFLNPEDFCDRFGYLDIPKVLHRGKVNRELIECVENGTLEGMSFEGVVCKGKNDKKTSFPVMFKIKNKAWLQKLKTYCHNDEKLFERLA